MRDYYSAKTKMLMQLHYGRLLEKDRRRYAAIEAEKLGYGGISYISRLLGINRKSILLGKRELQAISAGVYANDDSRQRKVGGGRKKNGARI